MGREIEPAIALTPSTLLTLFSTLLANASPVLCVIVTSTCPESETTLRWSASIMVGRMVPMPKITITPMTMASVVRNARSLRPHRYFAASDSWKFTV